MKVAGAQRDGDVGRGCHMHAALENRSRSSCSVAVVIFIYGFRASHIPFASIATPTSPADELMKILMGCIS